MTETLQSFQEQVIADALARIQENPFKPDQVKKIYENWVRESFNVTVEQNDRIGVLWVTEILGSDENTLRLFREDATNDEIGLKHAGVVDYQANSRGFWQGVQESAPNLVRSSDLEFLIEHDHNGEAAWAMICLIDEMNPQSNFLTTRLVNNALLYK